MTERATDSSRKMSEKPWSTLFEPIQERYRELRADERELKRLLAAGAAKASEASAPTLELMLERMGFVRP